MSIRGIYSYRRTLEFLKRGDIHLKNSVKVIMLRYSPGNKSSTGIRYFIGESVPQIHYKNQSVQILPIKDSVGYPHIRVFFEDGNNVTVDCEDKASDKILDEFKAVAAKLESQVLKEEQAAEVNMANFGDARRGRFCICEIPGQVPCPRVKPIENVEHKWHNKEAT